MNIHKDARLTPLRRKEMAVAVLSESLSKALAERQFGVCARIVTRWTDRFRAEGRAGMQDRLSRPHVIPTQTAEALAERIITHRRQRLCGRHVAEQTGVSPATFSRVLRRAGLSRLRDLAPPEPVVRHEYRDPGGLIHLDIKKLGRLERVGLRITRDRTGQGNSRGAGWVEPLCAIGQRTMARVHIAIDDASRVAVTGIRPDETATGAIACLRAAAAFYQGLGIPASRVMTGKGSCNKARLFTPACKDLGLKHIRPKLCTPKTNGKAERFIQTALRDGPTPAPATPRTSASPISRNGPACRIGTARTAAQTKSCRSAGLIFPWATCRASTASGAAGRYP